MTLKLKLLRIIAFIMEEFDLDHTHLFVLIMEEVEGEELRIDQLDLTTLTPNR